MSFRLRYFYHPESDSYCSMTATEYAKACKSADGQLLVELSHQEYLDRSTPKSPIGFRVSQSKVKTYRRCKQAYHLKYVEELRARKKSRALSFGSTIHKMIEYHLNGDDPMLVIDEALTETERSKLFAAEKQELVSTLSDARAIMSEYFEHWAEEGDFTPIRMKRRSAEHGFEIEILPDVWFNGKIDALGRHRGLRWVVEHKSFKRRPTDDDRWRNLQSSVYFRAMDILGWPPVDGVCWDYIWSTPPRVPELLQSGKLSSKSIDTLPSTVAASILKHGLDPEDYSSFLGAVKGNRSKWFQRVYTPVNESVRAKVFEDFMATVREMVEYHGKRSEMNIDRHCSWCEFEPLCRAKLQGLDYDFVKERNYEANNHQSEAAQHRAEYDEEERD